MEAADLLIKLNEKIASPLAADVFKTIYLDPLVLQALNDPDVLENVLAVCGSAPDLWTPAGISLAASALDLSVDDLKTIPLQPISAEIRQQVSAIYQKVLLKEYAVSTLSEAVFIALAIRERRRLTDSWNGLSKEITRNFSSGCFTMSDWITPLSILTGFSLDDEELLSELNNLKGYLSSADYSELMFRIVITNFYQDQEDLSSKISEIVNSIPGSDRSQCLDWLEQHGYNDLAESAAKNLSTDMYQAKEILTQVSLADDPLENNAIFEQLSSIHNQVKVIDFQKNNPIKEALMREEEKLIHQAEAILTSIKARSDQIDSDPAEWKKVVDLVPESDLAKAELALAYLHHDDQAMAHQMKWGDSYHPLVLAVKGFLANQQGNLVEAELYLDHLRTAFESSPSINRATIDRIVDLIGNIDLPEKVDEVLKVLPFGMSSHELVIRTYANQFYKSGKYAQAKQYAEASLLLNPKDLNSHRLLAKSAEMEQDFATALKVWETITQSSDEPHTEDQRAYANCAVRSGQPQKAIDICNSILEINPMDGSSYVLLGDAYQQIGNYAQAKDVYEKAVTIAPELEETWNKLAAYYLANHDQNKAVEVLTTAIKAVPHSANLHYQLGCQYAEQDSNAEAIQQFHEAYNIQPKNLDFIKALGKTYSNAGMWQEAEEIYIKANQTYPFDQAILHAYCQALVKQNKKEAAYQPYQHLIELHPAKVEPYIEFGRLVIDDLTGGISEIDIQDEAQINILTYTRDVLDQALDTIKDDLIIQLYLAEVYSKLQERELSRDYYSFLSEHIFALPADLRWRVNYGLGLLSGQMGQYEVALAALQEAASQNPTNFQVHQQLAEAYLKANLGQSALQAAQQALSIDPRDPGNLIWYAEFCTRSNELPEALSTLDAILKIQPENINLRIKLGSLQLKTGMIDQAKETFRNILAEQSLKAAHYQLIAAHLADAGEFGEAIAYLKLGIQNDPTDSLPLLLDLVQYEQKSGDVSSALKTIEQAIGMDPQNIRLQIIKADMLSFAKDYEAAVQTLEQAIAAVPAAQPDDELSKQYAYEIQIRLAYLCRKTGALIQSKGYAQKILANDPGDAEASFLFADISFHQLDLTEALNTLSSQLAEAGSFGKFAELSNILQIMTLIEQGNKVEARRKVETIALGSRWYLWKSALDVLTLDSGKLDIKTTEQIKQELDALTVQDLEQLIPVHDRKLHILPDLPVYDPIRFSPTLNLVVVLAAAQVKSFETAHDLLDALRDDFPYEVSPIFTIAKVYTLQAEEHRLLELAKVKRHLPALDSLSLGSYETFEEMILATQRISTADQVEDWHQRGVAAFYPTSDNLAALLERPAYALSNTVVVWKMALENRIGEMKDYLDQTQADVLTRSLAAILTTDKAPTEALELIQPVVDFLVIHPRCLATYAIVAENAGELQAAQDTIENALTLWNDEPEWHIQAGRLCLLLDNPAGALHHLKIAADLEPENFSYAMKMGDAASKTGDFMQAIQYFRKAAQLDPVNDQPWFSIAKAYQGAGDINQALASIERCVTLAPNKADPQILSAKFSLSSGKVEAALKKLDSALRIDPKNVDGLALKARTLMAAGQSEEALTLILHSLKKVSNALPLLLTRAEITREKDGPKAYLKSLQDIAQDYPKDTRVLPMYAHALAENNQPADALHITQLALKNGPELIDMHILAGRLLRTSGQLDQAIDHFSACINLDNMNIDAYLEMARTYQERRDYNKATTVYQKAIETAPQDYRPYYQLGLLLRDAKDYRGAEIMLRKASELAKEDVNILRQLGAIIALNLVHNSQEASVQS
jgi:tetratricopeptide (TPR) repeat protein